MPAAAVVVPMVQRTPNEIAKKNQFCLDKLSALLFCCLFCNYRQLLVYIVVAFVGVVELEFEEVVPPTMATKKKPFAQKITNKKLYK
jgi:hypothetical protein